MFSKLLDFGEVGDADGVLDVIAETVKGVFQPNTNSGRTQFRAIVLDDSIRINVADVAQLNGLNIDGAEAESVFANTSRQAARLRIIEEDSPHGCLPAPRSLLSPDQNDLNSIALHPLGISQVTYENSLASTLMPGDIVWCTFERGPDGGKVENLQIIPKEYVQKPDSRVTGLTHRPMAITKMRGPAKSLAEIYDEAAGFVEAPTPAETLNHLREIYPGASDEFLFGLMGNISAESGFDNMIGGDATTTNNPRALTANGLSGQREYCAIGAYQMNVCSKSAAGSDYLKWAGDLDPVSNPSGAMLALTNWKQQNNYVKSWMESRGVDTTSPPPPRHGSWTEYIMKEFENPADQSPSKVRGREAGARKLRNELG